MKVKTMKRATAFNNAGARYFKSGDYRTAWDLFKGALEMKLFSERIHEALEPMRSPLQNPYILRSEIILKKSKSSHIMDESDGGVERQRQRHLIVFEADKNGVFFDPYVYLRPFDIPEERFTAQQEGEILSSDARLMSAIIIFNLALVEHMFDPSSETAVSLYELASSLLVGDPLDILGIALINNIGIWCFENDSIDTSQRCMEHLSKTMKDLDTSNMKSEDRAAIIENVNWILWPPSTASAAA